MTAVERRVRRDIHGNLGTPVEGEWGYCQTHKHGIMGDGSRAGGIPHASMFNVQEQTFLAADAGGTANAITLSITNFNPTAYVKYQRFVFLAASNNTGSTTINVASLGAKTIKKFGTGGTLVALQGGEIRAGNIYVVQYDGTDFILLASFQHATESVIGVAEIATQAEVDAGTDDTRIITPAKLSATTLKDVRGGLETEVDATNGGANDLSEIDFTGISSNATRITVMWDGISKNGTARIQLQIGDSGGIETTGYDGGEGHISGAAAGSTEQTDSFQCSTAGPGAAQFLYGKAVLTLQDATDNLWHCLATWHQDDPQTGYTHGTKSLSGTLDRVRLDIGANTFDAGTINILVE